MREKRVDQAACSVECRAGGSPSSLELSSFPWQPSGCTTQRLSYRITPVCVKTNKQQERIQHRGKWTERIPPRADIGSCISDHISGDSLWKHREILGIKGGSVWPPPSGSVLCSFSTLCSCSPVRCFPYYFFLCKTSVWIRYNPIIQSKIPGGG